MCYQCNVPTEIYEVTEQHFLLGVTGVDLGFPRNRQTPKGRGPTYSSFSELNSIESTEYIFVENYF